MENKNNYKNLSNNSEVVNSKEETFFCQNTLFNTYQKINPTGVLEFIKENTPVSIWDISNKLKINRNTLYYFLRDLELTGIIKTKISINEHSRAVRLVYYNKQKQSEGVKNPHLNNQKINRGDLNATS